MKILNLAVLSSFLSVGIAALSQDKKLANDLFNDGNYEAALEEYAILLEEEPENLDYNYRMGVCYLNTNIDKSKAASYFEFVTSLEKFDPEAWYLLGRAYQFSYEFDKAIDAFTAFEEESKGSPNLDYVAVQIEYCDNAKERMKFPVNVSFENLGPGVNTPFADYYPFVPADESFVAYTTRRGENSEQMTNGMYAANVYWSSVYGGEFKDGKSVGEAVNTDYGDEEIIGLSSDGAKALLYINNFDAQGDLFICDVTDGKFENIEKLPKVINSSDHEIAACFADNGQAIYFASDRSGGYGGVDIYVSRILPNGEWGPAQNLGPTINTDEDEDFPNVSADGTTLYFSSRGHTSMGGYDIYKATWDSDKSKWSGVINIGYPINTPDDDMNFRVSESGRYGYIATLRAGGYGDLDIYRVTYNEIEPRYTVINGTIELANGSNVTDAYISVYDMETMEVYGDYLPNPKTHRYVIILPPGKFEIIASATGCEDNLQEIEIFDKSSYRAEINRDIILTPNN